MLRRCFKLNQLILAHPCYLSTYQSNINLRNIYPNSSLDICNPSNYSISNEDGKFTGFIPFEELDITYSRSSGPGGQNVNKVNSKVDLRFHLKSAKWLPIDIREKLSEKYKTNINSEGFLILRSDRTRSQQLNVADALDKLRFMIKTVIEVIPTPDYKQVEISRRRQERMTRERLREKRERSIIKRDRQGIDLV